MKRYKKAENKTYLAFCCMLLDWDGETNVLKGEAKGMDFMQRIIMVCLTF